MKGTLRLVRLLIVDVILASHSAFLEDMVRLFSAFSLVHC